ncbi:MAG TPA: hypothetical protein VIK39_17650 [Candidatus Angelobacter sp.]
MSVAAAGIVLESFTEDHPILSIESLDNVLTGILAALLAFTYEQKRYHVAMDKVRVIAEMNHHVRNALQAIICCGCLSEQKAQMKLIAESVKRIEWALREILPGDVESKD